ncbi:hypothetical protein AV530_001461 [Patagioenas fasciata monilis]|uniref:Uncharacterized protein n=1 Tax=Patagioenas fasciata monilis TaxID=372326 RepID=A0A1V4J4T3_PATFA|nr:hypothetical protein AV530_001461 [Patagioenas fasciata monilis]
MKILQLAHARQRRGLARRKNTEDDHENPLFLENGAFLCVGPTELWNLPSEDNLFFLGRDRLLPVCIQWDDEFTL